MSATSLVSAASVLCQMHESPLQSTTSLSSVSVVSHFSYIVLISCSFHISSPSFMTDILLTLAKLHHSYQHLSMYFSCPIYPPPPRMSTSSSSRIQQLTTQRFPFHHLTAACNHHHHIIWCNACSGFGFVSFYTLEECEKALQAMNGGECDGRLIRVEKAKRNSGYSKTPGVCKCRCTPLLCWHGLSIDGMDDMGWRILDGW